MLVKSYQFTGIDFGHLGQEVQIILGVNKRKDMTSSFQKDPLRQYINQLKKQCTRKIYKRSSILGLRTTLVLKRCGLVRAAPT